VKIGERQSVLKEANLKRVNKLLTYAVMLDSPILSYIQFVIMLIELRKVLNQELKCSCSKTTTVLSERTVPNTMDVSLLHFIKLLIYCIEMYVYHIEVYVYSIEMYISYTVYTVGIFATGPCVQ